MLDEVYQKPPAVRANLVQGSGGVFEDGAGSSRGISNSLDRERLLDLRRLCDVLVTDGETARTEQYRIPKVCDLAVITRSGFTPAAGESKKKYLEFRSSPVSAIQNLKELGYERILLEVGPNLLRQLFATGTVDQLCLTNTSFSEPDLSKLGVAAAQLRFSETTGDTTFSVWDEIRAV
jgi:riboflavin biosynthesis pyrimidine reductase